MFMWASVHYPVYMQSMDDLLMYQLAVSRLLKGIGLYVSDLILYSFQVWLWNSKQHFRLRIFRLPGFWELAYLLWTICTEWQSRWPENTVFGEGTSTPKGIKPIAECSKPWQVPADSPDGCLLPTALWPPPWCPSSASAKINHKAHYAHVCSSMDSASDPVDTQRSCNVSICGTSTAWRASCSLLSCSWSFVL